MLERSIALLIVLWCSLIAGVGYARRGTPPPVDQVQEARPETLLATISAQPRAAPVQPDPTIRIILPSPYQQR